MPEKLLYYFSSNGLLPSKNSDNVVKKAKIVSRGVWCKTDIKYPGPHLRTQDYGLRVRGVGHGTRFDRSVQ